MLLLTSLTAMKNDELVKYKDNKFCNICSKMVNNSGDNLGTHLGSPICFLVKLRWY